MPLQILTVEKDGGDGVLVTFSDGTTAGYIAEEFASLRPFREKIEVPGAAESGEGVRNKKNLAASETKNRQ